MSKHLFSRQPVSVPKISTSYRNIQTPIPAPGTQELLEILEKNESRSMQGQMPIVWSSARDFTVTDIASNRFIDFTSTIFVANVGHSNPEVSKKVISAINEGQISTYAYANEPRIRYLEKLLQFAGKPFEKAFLLSAGTEAMDAVLKLIRLYGQKYNKRRTGVISFAGNWHGRTMGAQFLSTNYSQKEWIGHEDPNIHYLNFPLPWEVTEDTGETYFKNELKNLVQRGIDPSTDIAGIVLETFQGWGALFYPTTFVKAIRAFCSENNILLAFDEMQSGFGRTGKKFGFMHYEVEPDLIACGKGMGGGFPLSGVIGTKEILDLPEVGNMSSTHSANPIVCSAGLAVLEELTSKGLIENAEALGIVFHNELKKLKDQFTEAVFTTQGRGLIASIIFKNDNEFDGAQFASRVSEACMRAGVLVVHTGRESIKLGPPLTITEDALLEGLQVLGSAIAEELEAAE